MLPEAPQSVTDAAKEAMNTLSQDAATGIGNALSEIMNRLEKMSASADPADHSSQAAGSESAKVSLTSRLTPRMLVCLLVTGILVAAVSVLSPAQLPVTAYKIMLIGAGGYLGYWLDRWAFPYARPDGYLAAADWRSGNKPLAGQANNPVVEGYELVFALVMLRRALVMLAVILGVGMAL